MRRHVEPEEIIALARMAPTAAIIDTDAEWSTGGPRRDLPIAAPIRDEDARIQHGCDLGDARPRMFQHGGIAEVGVVLRIPFPGNGVGVYSHLTRRLRAEIPSR